MPHERAPCSRVENLSVSYPGRSGVTEALREASFTLGRERLGIVGESGSGKSTMGRALLGLIPQPGIVTARPHGLRRPDRCSARSDARLADACAAGACR